jgi:hypothetical protein
MSHSETNLLKLEIYFIRRSSAEIIILSAARQLVRCHGKLAAEMTLALSIQQYRVSQNSRIPISERDRERPSRARKILEKKIALPEEDISTFNT